MTITAVNISNIANFLCAPHEANDAQARTVKRISGKPPTMGATGDLAQHVCQTSSKAAKVAGVAQKQRLIHHRDILVKATPIGPCSPCGILCFLVRRRARIAANDRNCLETGGCPVEW